jgi:endonuclease YncB( thermonuclease family)
VNPYSQEAKKHLTGLIYDKVVDVKGYGLDPYNRILGVVYVDGKHINLEMVKAKRVYQKYSGEG